MRLTNPQRYSWNLQRGLKKALVLCSMLILISCSETDEEQANIQPDVEGVSNKASHNSPSNRVSAEDVQRKEKPRQTNLRQTVSFIDQTVTAQGNLLSDTKNYRYDATSGTSEMSSPYVDDAGNYIQDIVPFPVSGWNAVTTIAEAVEGPATAVASINTSITEKTDSIYVKTDILLSGMVAQDGATAGVAGGTANWTMQIMVAGPSHVYITNCVIFDRRKFEYLQNYQMEGKDCSFEVNNPRHESAAPGTMAGLLQSSPLLFSTSGYVTAFIGSSKDISESFSISITDGTCPTEADAKVVDVQQGRRPSVFKEVYAKCSRDIITALNGNTPGLIRIGGPAKRCIETATPRKTKQEWFDETGGSCKAKDGNIDKWKEETKYDSEPSNGRCEKSGPPKTRYELFEETNGTCKTAGYNSNPSPHAFGYAFDLFVNDLSEPTGCELKAGDNIVAWAIANGDEYGIKNVIWNEKMYEKDDGWVDRTYSGGGTKHYDHVHIECEDTDSQ